MLTSSKTYFSYTVRDTSVSNVENLLFGESSFFQGFKGTTKNEQAYNFLIYVDETGNSNYDKLKEHWDLDQEDSFNIDSNENFGSYPITQGTTILIPFSVVSRDVIPILGDAISSVDQLAFLADALKRFYVNPKNVRTAASKVSALGSVKDRFNHISVWVWSKSLNSDVSGVPGSEQISYDKTLINITPFIININTHVGADGGTFSFSLDPIVGKIGDNGKWEIDWQHIKSTLNGEYISQIPIKDRDNLKSNFFFSNVLFSNDLIFIRFETLESEQDRFYNNGENPDLNVPNNFIFSADNLKDKIFDFIGLIDTTHLTENAGNSDISIDVTGRCLTKLLIEDGVYFYPSDFISGGIFANINEDDEVLQRFDGKLLGRFQVGFKKLDFVLQFIFNALSNIEICSDTLFESYKQNGELLKADNSNHNTADLRTHKYKLFEDQTGELVLAKGIWQIVKLVIDSTVQNRLLADQSIGNEFGSLLNAVRKICQEPFVEFFGDVYGDQYYFTVRKQIFDKAGFSSMINGISNNEAGKPASHPDIIIDINSDDITDCSLEYGTNDAFSWYRINPVGNTMGGDNSMAFAYLKAVFFKEYASIFGSKPLDISTNFIPIFPILSGEDQFLSEAYMLKQAIYDLKFLIESNQYLPFSKSGSITIQGGNRRIKRGMFVRLVDSKEIAYIESISHFASISMNQINRTTVLQLSHILKEEYIRGINVEGIEDVVSYFNIINIEIPENFVTNDKASWSSWNSQVVSKWRVNVPVFNYFLQQRHLQ